MAVSANKQCRPPFPLPAGRRQLPLIGSFQSAARQLADRTSADRGDARGHKQGYPYRVNETSK